jgi:hypothetical protein
VGVGSSLVKWREFDVYVEFLGVAIQIEDPPKYSSVFGWFFNLY